MRNDLLSQAAGALRETSAASPAGADTLACVLRDVRHRERRRRSFSSLVVALALIVMACGAWAAATGRLAALQRRLRPARAEIAAPTREMRGPRGPEVIPVEAPPPADHPEAPVPPRHFAVHQLPAGSRRTPAASRRAGDLAPPPPFPDELYGAAHEAHFARRDFSAALELWDRYLALTPLPRFAVEARYNRGIALLRLGRHDEAARALRPFADGDYGSYRTREARALLGASANDPSAPP